MITQRRAAVTNPLSPARRPHYVVLTSGSEQRVLGGAPPASHPPACTGVCGELDELRQMKQSFQPIAFQAIVSGNLAFRSVAILRQKYTADRN